MKSLRILLVAFCSGILINLNAQVFVGGSIGFHASSDKHVGYDRKSSNYNLNLRPNAGKFLSDKLAIGIAFDISMAGGKTDSNTESNTKIISRSTGFGVSPFLRYYAVKWNKFSVFGQGSLGAEFSRSSIKTGVNTNDGPRISLIDCSILPGLAYDISDKISLETSLNILSVGYSYNITKNGGDKETVSNFNIGAGLSNIVSLNAITIGAIYKF